MATKYAPPSPPFIAARHKGGSQVPKAIVMHGTVSSDNRGTARNIANWWAGKTSPVTSAHYTVDPGEVIQSVGDHTVAYHCGSNSNCIGVELCDEQTGPASRWSDADSTAILKRAARLVAELCLAYNIEVKRPSIADLKRKGKHGIYGHNDSRLAFGNTSHTDPRDFPWTKFINMVKDEVAKIKGEPTNSTDWKWNPDQKSDLGPVQEQFQIAAGVRKGKVMRYHGVAHIQNALNVKAGENLVLDGICDPLTVAAWKRWEAKNGGTGRLTTPDEESLRKLQILYRFKVPAATEKPVAEKPKTFTSDATVVIANVKSNPLMKPSAAQADYEKIFRGAKVTGAQAVLLNEYHRSYASALNAVAKKYGYVVNRDNASGLAVAHKSNKWSLSGVKYRKLVGGISGVSPNRGVLSVANTTPGKTRVVFDATMLPRGWNNPKYAKYKTTKAMAEKQFAGLKKVTSSRFDGVLKGVTIIGGDFNVGGEFDVAKHLGLKPAASYVPPKGSKALDRMMQAHAFAPAGWTVTVAAADQIGGTFNTDHRPIWVHFRITRPV